VRVHSFVHGGVHAIQRGLTGYPVELLANVVRSSNGLYTMAGMLLAILSGDEALAKRPPAWLWQSNGCNMTMLLQ
jgi:hypothetical protein